MSRPVNPREFLTPDETEQVRTAIERAEQATSAEIKLLVVGHCWGDIHDKARRLFHMHGLERTEQSNAVMILLVIANRELLVYGDQGIHKHVGSDFWLHVRDAMIAPFKEDRMGEGICNGIEMVATEFAKYFPRSENDRNEIPDEVAYDE